MVSKETKRLNYNIEEEALELLERFIKKYLHGNVYELIDFSFWDILTDEEFNNVHDEINFDGDRTKIVYAIDYLLYHDKISNLSLGDAKYNNNFSGDTIYTYNTLFGSLGLRKYVTQLFGFTAKELLLCAAFFRKYQTIGNFYILPNKTIKIGGRYVSINTFRGDGKNEWFDYFDVFLRQLKDSLDSGRYLSSKNSISNFENLLRENNFYFSEDKTYDSFISDFYLSEYEFLQEEDSNKYYHWNKKYHLDDYKNEYINFAVSYMEKATEFINNRSNLLVEELVRKYPQLKEKLNS